jgi:hypothetical protein
MMLSVFAVLSTGTANAVSVNDCNNTANPPRCRQAFQNCDHQSNPALCKEMYLNTVTQLSQEQAPPKSACDNTSNPEACKNAYEQCNTNSCKQNVIARALADRLTSGQNGTFNTGDNKYKTINDVCGGQVDGRDVAVGLSIKIGCKGKGNPIADAAFAIIRILSNGVGLVIIGSIVYGGIQYTGSRGDPQATAMAVNRIRSSLFALLLFIFGYAILNYLIPAGFLG